MGLFRASGMTNFIIASNWSRAASRRPPTIYSSPRRKRPPNLPLIPKSTSGKAVSCKSSQGGSPGSSCWCRAYPRSGSPTGSPARGGPNRRHVPSGKTPYSVLSGPRSDSENSNSLNTNPDTTPTHSHAYHKTQICSVSSALPDAWCYQSCCHTIPSH